MIVFMILSLKLYRPTKSDLNILSHHIFEKWTMSKFQIIIPIFLKVTITQFLLIISIIFDLYDLHMRNLPYRKCYV